MPVNNHGNMNYEVLQIDISKSNLYELTLSLAVVGDNRHIIIESLASIELFTKIVSSVGHKHKKFLHSPCASIEN